MTPKEQQQMLQNHASQLGEHFDSVILFAYSFQPSKERFFTLNAHSGGIMPMRAVVEDWLNAQKQYAITVADISQRKEFK